jgi:hypothetical protein
MTSYKYPKHMPLYNKEVIMTNTSGDKGKYTRVSTDRDGEFFVFNSSNVSNRNRIFQYFVNRFDYWEYVDKDMILVKESKGFYFEDTWLPVFGMKVELLGPVNEIVNEIKPVVFLDVITENGIIFIDSLYNTFNLKDYSGWREIPPIPKMKKQDIIEAFKSSIAHWADIMSKSQLTSGRCALCDLSMKFGKKINISEEDFCSVCPLTHSKIGGVKNCKLTPYTKFLNNRNIENAKTELDFLINAYEKVLNDELDLEK